MNNEEKASWQFNFHLENQDGSDIDTQTAETLLDVIVDWAEANDCQIGGGFKRPKPSDPNKVLFPYKPE